MKIAKYPNKRELDALLRRPAIEWDDVEAAAGEILQKVKTGGDAALRELTARFDGARLDELAVSPEEIRMAEKQVTGELKAAIALAARNIEAFHAAQSEKFPVVETMPGVRCWRRSVPIERVGLYIPGGTAPLFSTVLMLGIPARLAGCREVVMCTPPDRTGKVPPVILYAASVAGIARIFKVGGAQAIGAMTFGTESVPKVDKIFGPGNRYVLAAKMAVQKEGVAIDMPAGPSEVLVFAGDSCVPAFVASDLLSQAEHDPDAQTVLLTTSPQVLEAVQSGIAKQLKKLPRQEML
ncbi:MAG: histidinol dehydrogenase, partial [Saprospiraceae bacterium]